MPDSFSKRQRERDRQEQHREKADKRRARQANKDAPTTQVFTPDEAPAAGPGYHAPEPTPRAPDQRKMGAR